MLYGIVVLFFGANFSVPKRLISSMDLTSDDDVQSAVLRSLKVISGEGINLSDVNLAGSDLRGSDLTGANLMGANLIRADLSMVKLISVRFYNKPSNLLLFPEKKLLSVIKHVIELLFVQEEARSVQMSGWKAELKRFVMVVSVRDLAYMYLSRDDMPDFDELMECLQSGNPYRGTKGYKLLFKGVVVQLYLLFFLLCSWLYVYIVNNILSRRGGRENFNGVDLSGCVVDKNTISVNKITGCVVGVNGIYNSYTDSSALMRHKPSGDSMLGSSVDAIVESLKHARKLYNTALSMAGIVFLITFFKVKGISLPFLSEIQSDPIHLAIISIMLSFGALSMTESFMRSALDGTMYIYDQESAMRVGHFPWILSKYDKSLWGRTLSLVLRGVILAHPFSYLYMYYYFYSKSEIYLWFPDIDRYWMSIVLGIVIITYFLNLLLSMKIFILSSRFQKPILFDPRQGDI
jgi:uncharacterized protein YjbI with pentapeptide repeats